MENKFHLQKACFEDLVRAFNLDDNTKDTINEVFQRDAHKLEESYAEKRKRLQQIKQAVNHQSDNLDLKLQIIYQEKYDKIVEILLDSLPKCVMTLSQKIEKSYRHREEALAVLETWFSNNLEKPYPDENTKASLAEQTGLTKKQVETWFTNKRSKVRKHDYNQNTQDFPNVGMIPEINQELELKEFFTECSIDTDIFSDVLNFGL